MTAAVDADWRTRAACRGVDAEMFFPDHSAQAGRALHICLAHCKVRQECDAWASTRKWSGAVVGGRWWPADLRRRERPPKSDARGCRLCLEAR